MERGRRSLAIRRWPILTALLAVALLMGSTIGSEPIGAQDDPPAQEELDYQHLVPGQRRSHYRALFEFVGGLPSATGLRWAGFFDHSAEAVDLTLARANDERHRVAPDHSSRAVAGYAWRPYERRYLDTDFLGFIPISSMTVGDVTSEPLYLWRATLHPEVWREFEFIVPHDFVLGTQTTIAAIEGLAEFICTTNRPRVFYEGEGMTRQWARGGARGSAPTNSSSRSVTSSRTTSQDQCPSTGGSRPLPSWILVRTGCRHSW